MLAVAAQLHLPPRVLPSIQTVEAGQVGMVRTNINGTEDLGLMQINSIWVPALSQRTGLSSDIVRDKLLQDGCFNITVAGAVLRYYLRETHGNLLAAIGNYHSHTPPLNYRYQLKVIEAATGLFATHPAAGSNTAR